MKKILLFLIIMFSFSVSAFAELRCNTEAPDTWNHCEPGTLSTGDCGMNLKWSREDDKKSYPLEKVYQYPPTRKEPVANNTEVEILFLVDPSYSMIADNTTRVSNTNKSINSLIAQFAASGYGESLVTVQFYDPGERIVNGINRKKISTVYDNGKGNVGLTTSLYSTTGTRTNYIKAFGLANQFITKCANAKHVPYIVFLTDGYPTAYNDYYKIGYLSTARYFFDAAKSLATLEERLFTNGFGSNGDWYGMLVIVSIGLTQEDTMAKYLFDPSPTNLYNLSDGTYKSDESVRFKKLIAGDKNLMAEIVMGFGSHPEWGLAGWTSAYTGGTSNYVQFGNAKAVRGNHTDAVFAGTKGSGLFVGPIINGGGLSNFFLCYNSAKGKYVANKCVGASGAIDSPGGQPGRFIIFKITDATKRANIMKNLNNSWVWFVSTSSSKISWNTYGGPGNTGVSLYYPSKYFNVSDGTSIPQTDWPTTFSLTPGEMIPGREECVLDKEIEVGGYKYKKLCANKEVVLNGSSYTYEGKPVSEIRIPYIMLETMTFDGGSLKNRQDVVVGSGFTLNNLSFTRQFESDFEYYKGFNPMVWVKRYNASGVEENFLVQYNTVTGLATSVPELAKYISDDFVKGNYYKGIKDIKTVDSNDASQPKSSVLSKINEETVDKGSYTYKVKKGYYDSNSGRYGEVCYGDCTGANYNEFKSIGDYYYIPFNYKNKDLFVYIDADSVTTGNNYDTKCKVNVYLEKSSRYRAINHENPFPKLNGNYKKAPSNWYLYLYCNNDKKNCGNVLSSTALPRIANSYNYLDYKISLFDVDLDTVNGDLAPYNQAKVNPNGTSDFISNNNFSKSPSNSKYCKYGEWDSSCD